MMRRCTFSVAFILCCLLVINPCLSLAGPAKDDKRVALINAPISSRKKIRPAFAARVQTSAIPGQSITLLPDGRSLLLGGEDATGRSVDSIAISDTRTGMPVVSHKKLQRARSWHSATMLPTGEILVLGGVDDKGKLLHDAEIVDPETQSSNLFRVNASAARAFHTATLLTNGLVLIAGGTKSSAVLWDFKTKEFTDLRARLSIPRGKHKATLLTDGNVLIEDGVDDRGESLSQDELFDVAASEFSFSSITPNQPATFLSGSLPADGASDVPLDSLIGLRFSNRLRVESLGSGTVAMRGPAGRVRIRVIPAEEGRLGFVRPLDSLLPGVTYTIELSGSVSFDDKALTPAQITFTTRNENDITPAISDQPDWSPDESNLHGNWRSKSARSQWQSLLNLEAESGVTALAGQVLTLDGRPLRNVTLRINQRETHTDHTGRFLLRDISAGHQVLVIDGRSASRNRRVFGVFKVGVGIVAGKTTPLGYTVWMPKLDFTGAQTISSPTTSSIIVTNPRIPGLELRLPSGTVVRDFEGESVTQITITPIPTNRPPFPLPPNIDVPVYFTIQPGGSQIIPPRAQLIYPNFIGSSPGTRIDFWNYDASEKGWYIYGRGTVTPDAKQIVPDPGVVLYEFSGAMVGSPSMAPDWWPFGDASDGDPVDLGTGLFVLEKTDLVLPDIIPIGLTRTYRPNDSVSRPFGIGATHPFEIFLVGDRSPYTYAELILPDGERVHYDRISPGTDFTTAVYETISTPGSFYKSKIQWNGSGWNLNLKDGTLLVFPDGMLSTKPKQCALVKIQDRYGNVLSAYRDANFNLTKIVSPNNRWIELTYDSNSRITQAKDNIGRIVTYTYDTGGRLWKVTDPNNGVTEYTYDSSNRMLTVKDPKGIVYLTNEYDSNGRVTKQIFADETPAVSTDNPTYQFVYTTDSGGNVLQTDATNPRGNVRRTTFDSSGRILSDTHALGTSVQQTVAVEREAATNLILSVTDPLSRKTSFTYDSSGNVLTVTELCETVDSVTTTFTYEPVFNQIASVTDPLNHTTNYAYDNKGNLTSVTDPLSHQVLFNYNSAGQVISMADPVGNLTHWSYDSGDIFSITNPLGNVSSRLVDAAGRPISTSDALARHKRYTYTPLNQISQVVDALESTTAFNYDPNGNLLSLTDARMNTTSYLYDSMDRVISRKDPLLREDIYQYDLNGNLSLLTNRKGQITAYSYDPLDRLSLVTFADSSSKSFSYDAANRVTETVDSVSGTISFEYDDFDRLTSETTPQGSVGYTFDSADRLTSMTVAGQPTVSYTYDDSDRLIGISQGQGSVAYAYDDAGRRTSLTLPNGVITDYDYDAASNLTSISYRQGSNVLGNLTYEYDAVRSRTKVGGSFARTGLPQSFVSATYNAANQMTQRGAATFSYDNNGNLTTDGANTYSWDARDRLLAISGSTTASFEYDSLDRRIGKTANGSTNQYLYDGGEIVQELSGGTPTANMLNGAATDERHTCSCNGSNSTLLADSLGSAIALTDSNGTVQTQYTYDPFGDTTASGTVSSNASQFTGRENDGTGLYYYRARYFNPSLQRFISEDPLRQRGGDINFYAYVSNDPLSYVDPDGLSKVNTVIKIVRRVGGHMFERRTVSMSDAQHARRHGDDVRVLNNRRMARQIETGAFRNQRGAGKVIHHDAHEGRGFRPHYQTNGKRGHTFYGFIPGMGLGSRIADRTGCSECGDLVDLFNPMEDIDFLSDVLQYLMFGDGVLAGRKDE